MAFSWLLSIEAGNTDSLSWLFASSLLPVHSLVPSCSKLAAKIECHWQVVLKSSEEKIQMGCVERLSLLALFQRFIELQI